MSHLKSCHCCGLIQRTPEAPGAICARCETALESWLARLAGNRLTAAFALAGLILYLPAMLLPFLRIEQLGHAHESSLLVGVQALFAEGHLLVGAIVLVFSVILPVFKLAALLFLSQRRWQLQHRHRALTYRIVEHLGRWGMLDVLLVAVMVAFIKLGGLVEFGAGSGLIMFALFVLLSLCASAVFDPYFLWDEGPRMAASGEPAQHSSSKATTPAEAPREDANLPDSLPEATVPSPPSPGGRSPMWVWLIPAAALLLAGWVAWTAVMERGREITIHFTDGRGIEAGDELRYHGIVAGKVERVELRDQLQGVALGVRLTPEADRLARKGSRFWIVRPQAGISGVSGLETVMGSKYLTVLPGKSDADVEYEFVGLEDPPLPDLEMPGGVEVVLVSLQATGLRPGLGVYYRNVRIGGVIATGLAADGSAVETRVYIRPEGRHMIRQNTRFWNAGGVRVSGGLTNFSVHLGSVETIIHGGIAVAVPPDPGDEISGGARFTLHEQPEDEWLEWQPSVENRMLPLPENLPQLMRATLRWKHDGLISNSAQERMGWLLPVESALLGPRNLLAMPEDAIEASVELQVGEQEIARDGELKSVGAHLALQRVRGNNLVARPTTHRRIAVPEDGFLISGGNESPVLVAAARYRETEDGGWIVDQSVPIGPSHHGGVIVSAKDGAVIACLVYQDQQARLYPVPEYPLTD